MIYLQVIFSLFIFAMGCLVFIKGGREILDLITAGMLVSGGLFFFFWAAKIIIPALRSGREAYDPNRISALEDRPAAQCEAGIEECYLLAAAKVEDGESAGAITDLLVQQYGADRWVAEPVVRDLYRSRQNHFRRTGILLMGAGGIMIAASFYFQTFMNTWLDGLNRWSTHQVDSIVYALRLVVWVAAFLISVKGMMKLIFGGKGVKTKRPF